jgi:hypothetical protein
VASTRCGSTPFKVWWFPALMIAVGACCLACAGVFGDDSSRYIPLTLVGLPLTVVGPYLEIRGLFAIFSEDEILEICSHGIRARVDGSVRYVPWDLLGDVQPNDTVHRLVPHVEGGSTWLIPHPFMGYDDAALAGHVMKLRTKGLMGLLRPTPTWRESVTPQ